MDDWEDFIKQSGKADISVDAETAGMLKFYQKYTNQVEELVSFQNIFILFHFSLVLFQGKATRQSAGIDTITITYSTLHRHIRADPQIIASDPAIREVIEGNGEVVQDLLDQLLHLSE